MSLPNSITLVIRNGPDSGQARGFEAGEVIVGKDPRCDFVVNQRGVSRMHFRLEYSQRGWHLVDLRSTNGTLIGDFVVGGACRTIST
jgi:pSer/pThr/pTyr-binding forkhead associated (FHA) protein